MTPSVLLSCAACLREARKQKLSRALAAQRGQPPRDFFRQLAINYRQLAEIAGNPEIKQRMLDMTAHYQAKADKPTRRAVATTREANDIWIASGEGGITSAVARAGALSPPRGRRRRAPRSAK